ncbi:anti-sigma B factor antagonist [Peptoclostridium litorale DSM 5388]|uniref:Anti-sigma factor antagonist n=1 Tax=Peptoclostridium litorale DSM 5388 TaxID=1121324 RepID=A0A069RH93_PEPLI|nr:STAS domain-containing protein [Peptoclostridium litorale]KDR96391.1 anti-sigma factor antagonist [Peptoclostridium litorale DSM 5388]SIO27444.1 anti-sigma B factor antagonist [Peptoclostridium litorale DSM 5388]
MSLTINKSFNEDKNIWDVSLKGEVDIYTANKLKETLIDMVAERPQDILIDASRLEYIDSTGLGVLIGALKRLKQHEKDIYIKDVKLNVKKIFKITGLDKIFKVEG